MIWLIHVLLLLAAMLVLVPAFTGNGVRVQGGFFKAALLLVGISLTNSVLWTVLTGLTLFTNLLFNWLTLGLVELAVNGLAFLVVGRLFPGSLHVRNFWSAFGAALVMAVSAWGIPILVQQLLR